jgi:hypothetical protein
MLRIRKSDSVWLERARLRRRRSVWLKRRPNKTESARTSVRQQQRRTTLAKARDLAKRVRSLVPLGLRDDTRTEGAACPITP